MKKGMIFIVLLGLLAASWPLPSAAAELPVRAEAAVLMEKTTGRVLWAKNEHKPLEPASVTKVMTLLLVMEAVDSGRISCDDMVTASAYAASMGGSQVYLKQGEQMTVGELLKAVCIASGNDAAVALAEYHSGVTELFVAEMNRRAAELGMKDTHFVNCTGLPAAGHVTSAYDIALMSRELILHHPSLRQYTATWMDTLRDGAFQLANTNKLIRFYDGATGLKTGSTDGAGYCISATAERDGMELIGVILKGKTSDERFEDAKTLLNYGFSTYCLRPVDTSAELPAVAVKLGAAETVQPVLPAELPSVLVEKSRAGTLTQMVELPDSVAAPLTAGQQIGTMQVCAGEEVVLTVPLCADRDVAKLRWRDVWRKLLTMTALHGE